MKIISIKDLQNTDKIENLCKDGKEPIFVEQDGDIKFVIFEFDYYNDLTVKLNEAKLVNEGFKDLQNGEVVDGQRIKDNIKKKF